MTHMGSLLFALFMAFAPQAFASLTVGGTIGRIGPQITFRVESRVLRVSTRSKDIQQILNRLEEGDSIVATGEINNDLRTIEIASIDFVGLRKMLGIWNSTNARGILQFKTYSELKIYTVDSPGHAQVGRTRNFKYTVSPANDDNWVLFLSDNSATKMAFLRVEQNQATIRMLDSETGEVTQVLHIQKVGN